MKKFQIGICISLLIVSIIFITFFSFVSSPFTFRYVGDSSIFILLGKLFTLGKIPYVEYFDHKGPSLVLVEALGQYIHKDRGGVYIIEIVNLFFCLILIHRTCSIFSNPKISFSVIFIFLLLFSLVITGGNTSEEFCLVPLLVAGLYANRFFKVGYSCIHWETGFWVGLAFSFIFWTRLNNAGFIVSFCIFIFVQALLDKKYKDLIQFILGFILGQIPFTTLYLTYFNLNDGIYAMIYATFLFNAKYVNELFSTHGEAFYLNYLLWIVALFTLLPWLYSNVILSGYLIYPLVELDLFSVDWKLPKTIGETEREFIKEGAYWQAKYVYNGFLDK